MSSILDSYKTVSESEVKTWFKAAPVSKFPANGGACVKVEEKQIAVFNFASEGKWYASQNVCPHKMEMVLSRGMTGEDCGTPKISCPLHKKSFSLETGEGLGGEELSISVYPVKIEDDFVFIGIN